MAENSVRRRRALVLAATALVLIWSGTACFGGTADPAAISQQLMEVLLDLKGLERASRCQELLSDQEEFLEGKPYAVKRKSGAFCGVVSEGKPEAKSYGGFHLASFSRCKRLEEELAQSVAKHENNVAVQVGLYCREVAPKAKEKQNGGEISEGTYVSTAEPDASVRLAAQIALRENLATVVKAVNEGKVSANVSKCYETVKKQMERASRDVRKLRCQVMESDMNVPKVTYAAIWERAHVADDFDQYRQEHGEAYEAAVEQDAVSSFLNAFTMEALDNACAERTDSDFEVQHLAAKTAVQTCL